MHARLSYSDLSEQCILAVPEWLTADWIQAMVGDFPTKPHEPENKTIGTFMEF